MIDFCLLCLSSRQPLSNEHIFPKSLGGRIHFPILCTSCNSTVGHKIDAPFLDLKVIQFARSVFGISENSKKTDQPFSDRYSINIDGSPTKFKIKPDFSASIIPTAPKIFTTPEGFIKIELSRDVEFSHQIPKIIETALRRFFASPEGETLGWSTSEQENAIHTSIQQAVATEPVETKISTGLSGNWKIDLRKFFVEHVKIIYEISCIETGGAFSRTIKGEKIRKFLFEIANSKNESYWSLHEKSLELTIAPMLPKHLTDLMDRIANQKSHTYHMAVTSKKGIIVNTLGFGAMLYAGHPIPKDEDANIYFSSIKDGRYGIYKLSPFISSST